MELPSARYNERQVLDGRNKPQTIPMAKERQI